MYDLPKLDSFIIPKDEDDIMTKLNQIDLDQSKLSTVSRMPIDPTKGRLKRWLKGQDRAMVKSILDLCEAEKVQESQLFENLEQSEDTKRVWTCIKDKLDTDRSIEFLQSRYYKLKRNQKLNNKEMSLLSDKYDQIPIKQLMVVFPGKSKETLLSLITQLKQKDRVNHKKEECLDKKIGKTLTHPVYTLGKLYCN